MGASYRTIELVRRVEYPSSIEIRVRLGYIIKCYKKKGIRIKDHENQVHENARLALRVY